MSTLVLRFLALAMLTATSAAQSASALPYGHPSASAVYPRRDGFTLWLVEEFDQPLDLDNDPVWTWGDGAIGEGQVRFVREGIRFEEGKLVLEVSSEEPAVPPQACSHAESGWVGVKPLSSGELRTRHNMFRYGYYEARMRAPMVQPGDATIDGNYISTIFVYRDANFRHWREIDIEITGDSFESFTTNVISAEETFSWSPDIESHVNHKAQGQNLRADFHTFAFEWLPSGITWYLDGEVVAHHGPDEVLPVPELSGKIMMNLWVFNGGTGFGGTKGVNDQYPMRSEYDWFRFYKWNGDETYPCTSLGESCLTDDDRFLSGNNPCDGIPQLGGVDRSSQCTGDCKTTVAQAGGSETFAEPEWLLP